MSRFPLLSELLLRLRPVVLIPETEVFYLCQLLGLQVTALL